MAVVVRVKICGITSEADALAAVEAGADALGLVFYPPSPRYVPIERATAIARVVPPFVTVTGLFVDAEPGVIERTLTRVPLSLLQFHGDETPEQCRRFAIPYIKSLRMGPDAAIDWTMAAYSDASGVLVDAYRRGVPGGTGERFDWQRVPRERSKPLILAGGLTPDNIAAAITSTSPYAVDVSGGVEVEPGRKDPARIRAFIDNVRASMTEETVTGE